MESVLSELSDMNLALRVKLEGVRDREARVQDLVRQCEERGREVEALRGSLEAEYAERRREERARAEQRVRAVSRDCESRLASLRGKHQREMHGAEQKRESEREAWERSMAELRRENARLRGENTRMRAETKQCRRGYLGERERRERAEEGARHAEARARRAAGERQALRAQLKVRGGKGEGARPDDPRSLLCPRPVTRSRPPARRAWCGPPTGWCPRRAARPGPCGAVGRRAGPWWTR